MDFWHEIEEDLFVIKAEGLEDFRAVMGAKTSRASDLNVRADIDKEGLEKFLTLNLAGYGHASIGEMSFPSIHHRGLGWVGAWLLEDDPLFVGQEVSTRAVDVRKVKNGSMRCYDSMNYLDKHNEFFWDLFTELNEKNDLKKGYKFDNIRWAMPGTARLGVTYMMNTRAAIRHLERLESLPFAEETVQKMMIGLKSCSPFVFEALRKSRRKAHDRWKLDVIDIKSKNLDFFNTVDITPPKGLDYSEVEYLSPRSEKDYLDPDCKKLGIFKIKIMCSIAAARDWHRHRPMMPWKISLLKDDQPFIAPWYEISEESTVKHRIKEDFAQTKNVSAENSLQRLYSLPFGTMVAIEGQGSLNDLLYMLELRAAAGGNNFEYAAHAKEGLKKLVDILDKAFVEKHSIDRVLKQLKS